MSRDDGWSAAWIAERLAEQKEVASVSTLSQHLMQVHRKRDIVLVGTIGVLQVRLADVRWVLSQQSGIKFVANVPTKATFSGDAITYAKKHGAAIGGFGDLRRALTLRNPASYVDRETAFRERGLEQHDRVEAFHRLDDNRYTIERDGLPPVTVVFLYDYDLSADAVRTAISECGPFQAVIQNEPEWTDLDARASGRDACKHQNSKMGRIPRGVESYMDLDILSQLVNEAERISPKFRDVRWYAFGSWARGESAYNDIDVLIVYGDGIESQALREELKKLSLSMPLDLYLFHEEEEQEFTFVEGQKCRCIFPPEAVVTQRVDLD